jgi:hypothetical protein
LRRAVDCSFQQKISGAVNTSCLIFDMTAPAAIVGGILIGLPFGDLTNTGI